MTAKEYLEQAAVLNKQINDKRAELQSYRDLSTSVSGCRFEEHLSGTRSGEAPFVRFTEKAIELEKEIRQDEEHLAILKCEIGEVIDRLDNVNERVILRYKYLLFLSWRDIGAKMNYSKRWVMELHDKAVLNFQKTPGSVPVRVSKIEVFDPENITRMWFVSFLFFEVVQIVGHVELVSCV